MTGVKHVPVERSNYEQCGSDRLFNGGCQDHASKGEHF